MRVRFAIVVLIISLSLVAGPAMAQFSASGKVMNPVQATDPRLPGDPVSLVVDDGSIDNSIGLTAGGQFIWLNRFAVAEFPIDLVQAEILFGLDVGINIGETFDIFTYSDTDGDGDPGTGAVIVGQALGATVAAVDDVTFTIVPLGPDNFPGPGEVIVAAVNRTAGIAAGTFVAAMDQTAPQVRSWIGTYTGGDPATPPVLPADDLWGTIDSLGIAGNWMLRASGSVVPVELMSFDIE